MISNKRDHGIIKIFTYLADKYNMLTNMFFTVSFFCFFCFLLLPSWTKRKKRADPVRSNTTFERHKHKTTSQYALLRLKQWDTQVCVCVSVCEASITQTCCLKVYKVCKCPWDMLSKFNTPLYTLTTMPTFNTWTASAKCSGSAGLFWGFAPTCAHTHTHIQVYTHSVSWRNSLETLWLGIRPINILFPFCPFILKSHFHRLTNTKAVSSLPSESVYINK